jgi:hypothetical protein
MEWNVSGLVGHPLHLHVAPQQINALPTATLGPNQTFTSWFEARTCFLLWPPAALAACLPGAC